MQPANRIVGSFVVMLAVAVVIPVLAALAFATIGHPECASIPEDVGPCGYWARVWTYGPFIVLWGSVVTVGSGAALWLAAMAVYGLVRFARHRR
ncbi:hypothetical protein [Nocardia yamanashiensis]|uniref:hypothetical protein n=1 Tax=Nocardia yamanashiensis TaxID=209247 RepID=UPI000830CF96|nr:hypothetical protein [Nocardia yamanashiensis]